MDPVLGTFTASEGDPWFSSQTDLSVNFHSSCLRLCILGPFPLWLLRLGFFLSKMELKVTLGFAHCCENHN